MSKRNERREQLNAKFDPLNLSGLEDRLATATPAEYAELKSFWLGSRCRNQKISYSDFVSRIDKQLRQGDSFRHYKSEKREPEPTESVMRTNNDLISQHRQLHANPAYWEIDMAKVDLRKAAAIVKSALKYGIIAEVPVATRAGQDGYNSKFKCQHGHTTMYAATKLYKLGESLEGQARIDHYKRFEHVMCLLLNDEVRPVVPAFDEVQSDEWIAGLLEPYQA